MSPRSQYFINTGANGIISMLLKFHTNTVEAVLIEIYNEYRLAFCVTFRFHFFYSFLFSIARPYRNTHFNQFIIANLLCLIFIFFFLSVLYSFQTHLAFNVGSFILFADRLPKIINIFHVQLYNFFNALLTHIPETANRTSGSSNISRASSNGNEI